MWLLREKLSDFGVKQILHRVDIALYVHPKNSLRSHLRAIMVLDHSRYTLRVEATFSAWKTNQTEFFAFEKSTLQILAKKSGCMQTNLLFFFYTPHLRRKSTMRRCFYHTDLYKMQYFTIFQDKLHSFNIQDHRSTRGLLISETVQKISKITYTASRF